MYVKHDNKPKQGKRNEGEMILFNTQADESYLHYEVRLTILNTTFNEVRLGKDDCCAT